MDKGAVRINLLEQLIDEIAHLAGSAKEDTAASEHRLHPEDMATEGELPDESSEPSIMMDDDDEIFEASADGLEEDPSEDDEALPEESEEKDSEELFDKIRARRKRNDLG